jgi:uncharacterized membrane protein
MRSCIWPPYCRRSLFGTFLLLRRKGTPLYRRLGRVYLGLMLLTPTLTLFMPARVGPRLLHRFGVIHVLSLVVIYNVPAAFFAARRRDLGAHRGHMVGVYVGGILIAGAFALNSGRLLNEWLFAT